MSAMTWWDRETGSVWSQPWGMAIDGDLKGTSLRLIPASIFPWAAWLAEHPETLVLKPRGGRFPAGKHFSDEYVIGITLGENAKAYPFRPASQEGVINDRLGTFPVVVLADAQTKAVHAYLRRAGEEEMEFGLEDGRLFDLGTGSTWDVARGIAVDGPLRGTVLQRVPYVTAFDWAWQDFYPHSEFFQQR